jgi:hypothetical protein
VLQPILWNWSVAGTPAAQQRQLTLNDKRPRVIRVSVLSKYFIKIVKLGFIHPILTELSYCGLATVNEHPALHEAKIKLYRLPQ